jgi:hypothetical protein
LESGEKILEIIRPRAEIRNLGLAQLGNEAPHGFFFNLCGRIEAQFQAKIILDARRSGGFFLGAAGLAENGNTVGRAIAVAEYNVDRQHAGVAGDIARDFRPLKPFVEDSALSGCNPDQLSSGGDRSSGEDCDAFSFIAILDLYCQPGYGAVACQIAGEPLIALGMIRELLIEIVDAQDHTLDVVNVLGRIRRSAGKATLACAEATHKRVPFGWILS